MANRLQRIFVATALVGSVAIGFHSARGQQAPMNPAMPGMIEPPPEGNPQPLPPALMPGASTPANMNPQQAQQLQQMQGGANRAMPGNAMPAQQPQPYPVNSAPSSADPQGLSGQASGMPSIARPAAKPVEEKPAAPSVVETILPAPKIGKETSAVLKTSMGDITIRLFTAQSPITTRNFMELARGEREFTDVKTGKKVKRPFYNGLLFHRVLKGFVIQTGCPYGTGRGGPGYTTRSEFSPVLRFNKPGMVAMAPPRNEKGELAKDSNGSQFFITLSPQQELDDSATIFGEVTKGLDVVKKIASVKTGPTDRPVRRVYLLSVDITDGSQPEETAPVAAPQVDPAPVVAPE